MEAWGLDRGLDRGKGRQHAGGSTQLPLSERKAEQRKAEEDSVQDLIEDGRNRKMRKIMVSVIKIEGRRAILYLRSQRFEESNR